MPAFDLLHPRLPSRRTRLAGALSAVLLAVALLDLVAVLAWSALAGQTSSLEHQIVAYQQRQAQASANAQAARTGSTAREVADLRSRLALLKSLPTGFPGSETLLGALAESLPPGGTLSGATLGTDGRLLVTGTLPSHAAVEAYVRALETTGRFAYVRVVSEAAGQGRSAPTGGTPVPSGVQFQVESWLRGEGTR